MHSTEAPPFARSITRIMCLAASLLALLACVISAQTHSIDDGAAELLYVVNSQNASDNNNQQYFPESRLVLDMAKMSNAVYHLRNKVESCQDAQAKNKSLIHLLSLSLQEEEEEDDETDSDGNDYIDTSGSSSSSSDSIDDDTDTTPKDIYQLLLPKGTECLHYSHDYSLGRQVLVVRSTLYNYVAVVYAGTDDWKTSLMDVDILTSDFGPTFADDDNSTDTDAGSKSNTADDVKSIFDSVPDGVRVHRGFNSAVFDNDGFHKILNCVSKSRLGGYCDGDGDGGDAKNVDPDASVATPYQVLTTGHSLGAADSVLLGAALHLAFPNETLRNINFGCPKIGNVAWSFWVDSLQPDRGGQHDTAAATVGVGSLEVFRFVNKIDLVPRLPELEFTHAGHTLQMSVGGAIRAYYDHVGSDDFGFVGVPMGWDASSFAFLPGAIASHISKHYVKYLTFYRPEINSTLGNFVMYYVHDFERVGDPANLLSSS